MLLDKLCMSQSAKGKSAGRESDPCNYRCIWACGALIWKKESNSWEQDINKSLRRVKASLPSCDIARSWTLSSNNLMRLTITEIITSRSTIRAMNDARCVGHGHNSPYVSRLYEKLLRQPVRNVRTNQAPWSAIINLIDRTISLYIVIIQTIPLSFMVIIRDKWKVNIFEQISLSVPEFIREFINT